MLSAIAARLETSKHVLSSKAQARLDSRRALTFLEYALLALVILAVFLVVNSLFRTQMEAVFERISNVLGGAVDATKSTK